jgi:hypothetical protein
MKVKYPLHEHGMSEHEHTKTDGLGDAVLLVAGGDPWRSRPRNERMGAHKIECNACPVLCQISDGKVGACDRYANQSGVLVRVDPVLLMHKAASAGEGALVPFVASGDAAAATLPTVEPGGDVFITAVGASTTLSGLQAGAVHRCVAGRRRRHGHWSPKASSATAA